MNKPINPLVKTCAICGQQKPLAAFLQLTGKQGASYGNVCSTCRQAGLDKAKPKEAEENTRSTTGLKIDDKARVKLESDKKNIRKEKEEQYFEEREEKDEKKTQTLEKTQKIASNEKAHRENYIDKKRSFLDSNENAKRAAANPIIGGEEHKAKEGSIRMDAPILDTQIAGKIKFQGVAFNAFKSWLGNNSPIAKATTQNAQNQPDMDLNESLAEIAEKKMGPKTK